VGVVLVFFQLKNDMRTARDEIFDPISVMPFGGFKQSGLGREFGLDSIITHIETKSIQVRF